MVAGIVFLALAVPAAATRAEEPSVRRLFAASDAMLVVAHRACHAAAPRHGAAASNPENSLAGIERCIALGVDVAEVDVRRTRDGFLVLMHDESVDRTTSGSGKVADLTLAQIRAMRLREDEGGPAAATTDATVPLLSEALAVARGRIILNLDVQSGLYAETVAAVKRARQEDGVIVKQPAGTGSPVLADTPPFDTVPFMPILSPGEREDDMMRIASIQAAARSRPVAIELPRMSAAALPSLAAVSRRTGIRLWANSLWQGFLAGYGGDIDALRDPDRVWGRMRRDGISAIQTDEPEALLRFLGR